MTQVLPNRITVGAHSWLTLDEPAHAGRDGMALVVIWFFCCSEYDRLMSLVRGTGERRWLFDP